MGRPPNVITRVVIEDCEIVKASDALACLKLGLRFTTVATRRPGHCSRCYVRGPSNFIDRRIYRRFRADNPRLPLLYKELSELIAPIEIAKLRCVAGILRAGSAKHKAPPAPGSTTTWSRRRMSKGSLYIENDWNADRKRIAGCIDQNRLLACG